jgi:hypothetical protein
MSDFEAMKNLASLMRDGISHIEICQEPDGSFVSLSSFSQTDFASAIPYRTTFFTSIILACMNSISNAYALDAESAAKIQKIREQAARFLIAEKSGRWSWNYWAHDARERKTMPYPDDLDDTFAALIALGGFNPAPIDASALAPVVKLLTATETQEGGPYRTWLVGDDADPHWKDIDLVANSNVAYFLSYFEISLPNIEKLVDDAMQDNRLQSPYYPGALQVAYFISRFYRGAQKEKLREWLLATVSASNCSQNPLEQAMAISALTHLHATPASLTATFSRLAKLINQNRWRPYAFCIDPSRDSKTCYAGSSALTAALCLEAIVGFGNASQYHKTVKHGSAKEPPSLHKKILALAESDCTDIGGELRRIALGELQKTSDEKITSLAHEFQSALGERGEIIPPAIIDQLALANLYGWIAYEIYDDFLDAEGNPLLLSCANLFLRKLAGIYALLDRTIPGAWSLFQTIMNTVDNANAWEQRYCHFPTTMPPSFNNYNILSDRSFGHALGPLTELLAIGHPPRSPEYEHVADFFRHYLIARQLHDDAHDWADDLSRGRINSVGALILAQFQEESGELPENQFLLGIIQNLQSIFWTKIIGDVAQKIQGNIDDAHTAREASMLLTKTDFMETALVSLKKGAEQVLAERNRVIAFLAQYKKVPFREPMERNPRVSSKSSADQASRPRPQHRPPV